MSSKRGVRQPQIGVMPTSSFLIRDGQSVGRQRYGQTVGGHRDGQTVGGHRDGQTVVGHRDGQTVTLWTPGYDIGGKGYLAQGSGDKLIDRGHPILVRTSPSERDLSVKLKKYFGSRWKSGGGECAVVRLDGQTYCTFFQDQDDKRRVLGRRNHNLDLTMPLKAQDIGSKDLARIRQLSQNEERLTGATSGDPLDTRRPSAAAQKEEPDTCPICLCEIEDKVILEKCKHAFCKDCLKQAMAHKPVCPICRVSYGTVRGNQPDGTMSETIHRNSLPGYPECGTIEIYYNIPGGIQKENHPRPGRHFSGTRRWAYLPDNKEGRDILRLLKKAFDQKLIFTVGDSRTTGATDTVTWNDIHHKTNTTGGPQRFGYPDPDYLNRVRDELRAKGIE